MCIYYAILCCSACSLARVRLCTLPSGILLRLVLLVSPHFDGGLVACEQTKRAYTTQYFVTVRVPSLVYVYVHSHREYSRALSCLYLHILTVAWSLANKRNVHILRNTLLQCVFPRSCTSMYTPVGNTPAPCLACIYPFYRSLIQGNSGSATNGNLFSLRRIDKAKSKLSLVRQRTATYPN